MKWYLLNLQKPTSELQAAIQLGIGQSVGGLSAKAERDLLMQDFGVVQSVFFPRFLFYGWILISIINLTMDQSVFFSVYYPKIIIFRGHQISWIDDIGLGHGYQIVFILLKWLNNCWDLNLMDCPTQERHEINCPTNGNDLTVKRRRCVCKKCWRTAEDGRWPTKAGHNGSPWALCRIIFQGINQQINK